MATQSRLEGRCSLGRLAAVGLICGIVYFWASLNAGPPSEAIVLRASQAKEAPSTEKAPERGSTADYVIDGRWGRSGPPSRVILLSPPSEPDVDSDPVARVVLPRRPEDLFVLKAVSPDNLHVDLWPYRGPKPRVHVRIFTDAVSLKKRSPSLRPRRKWLLLVSAVINLPDGVSIFRCTHSWRWVDFNGTEPAFADVVKLPFRALEVSCPQRPKTLMGLVRSWRPPSRRPGGLERRGAKDRVLDCVRLAFLACLLIVCASQGVLLLLCLAMLVGQIRMRHADRRG